MTKLPEKILLLYGYHPGTTASLLDRALRQRQEVFSVGPGQPQEQQRLACASNESIHTILATIKEQFVPDLLFVLESGVKFFPRDLVDHPLPCWYYAIDPHFNLSWQLEYAKLFDRVWVTFEQYLLPFQEMGHPAIHWLPHGYDSAFYQDYGSGERPIDVAFVGDMDPVLRPVRAANLARLQNMGITTCFTSGIWNAEVGKLYSRAKLVFNDNDHQVLNPRNFEASACGAVVLANAAVSLTKFFSPGEDLLLYQDADDLASVTRELLADGARRQAMSAKAKETAWKNRWAARLALLDAAVQQVELPNPSRFSFAEQCKAQAFVYQQRGLPGAAIELLHRLQQTDATDPEIYLLKAMTYMAHHFILEAAQEFDLLLKTRPAESLLLQVTEMMVATFEHVGHTAGALRLLEHPAVLTPDQRLRLQRIMGTH